MDTGKQDAGRALFRSTGGDGSEWLFIIMPDDRWIITHAGKTLARGLRRSVALGVRKFLAFTVPAAFAAGSRPGIRPVASARPSVPAAGASRDGKALVDAELGVLGAGRDIQIEQIETIKVSQADQ